MRFLGPNRALAVFMIAAFCALMLTAAAMVNGSHTAAGAPAEASPVVANGGAPQAEKATLEARGLLQRVRELEARMANQEWFDPPVGTVCAFAGPWPPAKGENEKWTEEELGWMLCDGRRFSRTNLPDLALALGESYHVQENGNADQYRLPDLRGLFLRGIDSPGDDGKLAGRDEDGQRSSGSFQDHSTALPKPRLEKNGDKEIDKAVFRTNEEPEHHLSFRCEDGRRVDRLLTVFDDGHGTVKETDVSKGPPGFANREPCLYDSLPISPVPAHRHAIEGGNKETRPINAAVHWFIKARPHDSASRMKEKDNARP